jgi:hypothetical protein
MKPLALLFLNTLDPTIQNRFRRQR